MILEDIGFSEEGEKGDREGERKKFLFIRNKMRIMQI